MEYSDILEAAKQLSNEEIKELKNQLDNFLRLNLLETAKTDNKEYLKLLLNGPTMTDEEYQEYLKNRKHFRKWREKELF